jgi:hypothetical protein
MIENGAGGPQPELSPSKPKRRRDMEGISRREAARLAGIDESTVRKAIKDGALDKALLSDGSLSAEKALRALAENIQSGRNVPMALTAAKSRRLRAQVDRLEDEVGIMRASAVSIDDIAAILDEQRAIVVNRMAGVPWDAGTSLVGKPSADAHRALRDLILGALERTADDDSDNVEPDEDQQIALSSLSANSLTAHRINLQAEKIEIETAISRGDMRPAMEVVGEFEEKLGACKSLLTSIPSRLAHFAEASTPVEFEAMVAAEIGKALAELRSGD